MEPQARLNEPFKTQRTYTLAEKRNPGESERKRFIAVFQLWYRTSAAPSDTVVKFECLNLRCSVILCQKKDCRETSSEERETEVGLEWAYPLISLQELFSVQSEIDGTFPNG